MQHTLLFHSLYHHHHYCSKVILLKCIGDLSCLEIALLHLLLTRGTGQASVEPVIYTNTTGSIHVKKAFKIGQFQIQSCSKFCIQCPNAFQFQLYFNGIRLSDSRVTYTIQNGMLVLNVSNATPNDFGVYETIADYCDDLQNFYSSCSPTFFREVGIFLYIYGIERFIIQQYGKNTFPFIITFTVPYQFHLRSP